VSIEAVAEAGDILAEEVDVLLERFTDKVLGSPGAGSIPGVVPAVGGPALAKRTSLEGQRLLVKSAIAARASIDPVHDIERVRRTGTAWVAIGRAAGLISRAARRRWGTTAANDRHPRDRVLLTIW